MKIFKYIICISLFLIFSQNIESQEIYKFTNTHRPNKSERTNKLSSALDYNYNDTFEADFNLSVKVVFPPVDDIAFSFIDFSAGIAYGIIKKFYYIGIAADFALGTDWFSFFPDDNNYYIRYNRVFDQFGISLGVRVYNVIKISNFSFIPFFGCDFMLITIPMLYAGAEIAYNIFGIEYAYYLPIGENKISRHQISIKFHFPKK